MVLINDNSTALAIGDALPHFILPAVDGLTIDTHGIRDPFLVVIFTCNHCPYAQAYEDRLVQLAEHCDEEGVQFILVSSNDAENYPDDSFEAMKLKAQEKAYPFPYCYDADQTVARSFGALCTPHCFVFDRERKLQYKGRFDDNWKDPKAVMNHDLRNAIAALIRNELPPVPEANAIGCSIKWK
jgi:peroxiredoxin